MKKQTEHTYIPDWQVIKCQDTEIELNQETDGTEEETEYRFYNYDGDDLSSGKGNTIAIPSRSGRKEYNDMGEAIRKWESIRYVI
jgi:hypothetical protein